MKKTDFKKYIGKKVSIVFDDGDVLSGELSSIVPDYDTESGKDEIELYIGGAFITEPIDRVTEIRIIR